MSCGGAIIPFIDESTASTAVPMTLAALGARLILKKFPIVTDGAQPHILVAHLDPLGVWLVWHATRTWYDTGNKKTPLLVTVMDHDPDKSLEALKSQHPALKKHCEFKLFHATAEHIREQLPAYHLDPATPPISCAYVTATKTGRRSIRR
jgi:hypothetical protein